MSDVTGHRNLYVFHIYIDFCCKEFSRKLADLYLNDTKERKKKKIFEKCRTNRDKLNLIFSCCFRFHSKQKNWIWIFTPATTFVIEIEVLEFPYNQANKKNKISKICWTNRKTNMLQGQKWTGAQSPMAPRFWSGLLNFYL